MSWLGDIAGGLVSNIPVVGGVASNLIQGGGSSGPDLTYLGRDIPGQTPEAHAAHVLQSLSSSERTQLQQLWAAANPQRPALPLSPWDVAHAAYGGNDGQVRSAAGRQLKTFWQSMERKYPLTSTTWTPGAGQQLPSSTQGSISIGSGGVQASFGQSTGSLFGLHPLVAFAGVLLVLLVILGKR